MSKLSIQLTFCVLGLLLSACGPGLCINASSCGGTPFTTPLGVRSFSGRSATATVTWDSVAGAKSYDLFWGTQYPVTPSNSVRVTGVTSPHAVTGLTLGTNYYFAVSAEGEGFSTSALSRTAGTKAVEFNSLPTDSPDQGNRLSSNDVLALSSSDSALFVGTKMGLSYSYDAGVSFTNKSPSNGIRSSIAGVFQNGETIYLIPSYIFPALGADVSRDGGSTFTPITGLVSDDVKGGTSAEGRVYLATSDGLAISTDDGATFTYRTLAHGLASINLTSVFADGQNIYASYATGVSISNDGGASFVNRTAADGIGLGVNGVFANGSQVLVATGNGVSISIDGGASFTTRTTAHGLVTNNVQCVFAANGVIFVGTYSGLSYSADGGQNFLTKTVAEGLASNSIVQIVSHRSKLLLATPAGLSVSSDGGNSFGSITNPNSPEIGPGHDYWPRKLCVANGNLYLSRTGSGLFISRDGGMTYSRKTTANGIGSMSISEVHCEGSKVFLATLNGGVSVSNDAGETFFSRTNPGSGLGNKDVFGIFGVGGFVYAATQFGFSISSDGGDTYVNRTTADGLGDSWVGSVAVSGLNVYSNGAVAPGVYVSNNGGAGFSTRTTANGLGSNTVFGLFADGSNVYVATLNGLAVSTNAGASFTNRTTADGLASNAVASVWASGLNVYASTDLGISASHDGGISFTSKPIKGPIWVDSGKLYVAHLGISIIEGF